MQPVDSFSHGECEGVIKHAQLLLRSDGIGGGGEHEREDDVFGVGVAARPSLFRATTAAAAAAATMESSELDDAAFRFSAGSRCARDICRTRS